LVMYTNARIPECVKRRQRAPGDGSIASEKREGR
jgi:hypothetical protein